MQLPAEQQIPRSLWQLATAHQLGSPQVLYTTRGPSSLSRLPGVFVLLFGCLLLSLFLYLYFSTDLLSSWLWWQLALAVLICAIWLLMGLWIILASLFARRLRVVVCTHGLLYGKRKLHAIRWEQIAEFWKDIQPVGQGAMAHSYKLHLLDGTGWQFNDALLDVEELGAMVEDEVIQHLFPMATTAYVAGKVVSFGAITVSQEGISVREGQQDQQTLPWALVCGVHLDETALSFLKLGESRTVVSLPVAAIPNAGILKRLVEETLLDHDPVALSAMIGQYASGLPVFFGDLSLSLQGIAIPHADRFIPWSEVVAVEVGETEMTITRSGKAGGRYMIPLVFIAKVSLLKDFIAYLRTR